jgi:hypothetical protein
MSSELDTYKQNRIAELKNTFNGNVTRLYNSLAFNIKAIQNSYISPQSKQQQINNQVNVYYTNVSTLQKALNIAIVNVQSLTLPKSVVISNRANKKALLIGINYTGTQNELYGCINDLNSIKERITAEGFTNINVLTDLTTKKATRANILIEFKNFLVNSKEGDLLFFLYSGHGSNILDKNGDETDGYDEMIVSCDLQPVLDDELKALIQANLKPGVTLFAMFDSCFSGSVLDLKYQYMDSLNYEKYTENAKELETLGDVFMISGCTDQQTSSDAVFNNKPNGAMTWSLLESLKQKPICNWRELVTNMRTLLKTSNFEQIPQFSCGKFENIDAPIFI